MYEKFEKDYKNQKKSYSQNCNVECICKALRYKAMFKIRGFLCVSVRSE